jgi:hypothetical protein
MIPFTYQVISLPWSTFRYWSKWEQNGNVGLPRITKLVDEEFHRYMCNWLQRCSLFIISLRLVLEFHPAHCQAPTSWKVFQSSFSGSPVIFHAAHLPLLHNSCMPTPDSLASAIPCFDLFGRLVKAVHLDVLVSWQMLALCLMVCGFRERGRTRIGNISCY